jgi:hypothetical protein
MKCLHVFFLAEVKPEHRVEAGAGDACVNAFHSNYNAVLKVYDVWNTDVLPSSNH